MSAPIYGNATDQNLLNVIQERTLETPNNGASMTTAQFGNPLTTALSNVIAALNQAQQDFVRDTGVIVWHSGYKAPSDNSALSVSPDTEKVALPQDMSDVRRFAWIGYNAGGSVANIQELPVQGSWVTDSSNPAWETSSGLPLTTDEGLASPPATYLAPPSSDIGQLDCLYVPVATALSNTGVPLSVPPDFSPAIVWRALELLLTSQTEGADPQRARFAHGQYLLWVRLTRALLAMPNMIPMPAEKA